MTDGTHTDGAAAPRTTVADGHAPAGAAPNYLAEQFRALGETVPEILFTTTPDGWCDYCNERFERMTGQPTTSAYGWNWSTLVHPDDVPRARDMWLDCLRTGRPCEIEYRLKTADGSFRWFLGRSNAVFNADGEIVKWVGCASDIHDLKGAHEALQQSRAHLRAVLSTAPIVLWAADPAGVFTLSEGKGLAAVGRAPGEVVGKSCFDLYRDAPTVIDTVRRTLAGETFVTTVEVGGGVVESRSFPLRDEAGRIIGAMGVATDITELKRTETSLRQARDELDVRVQERTSELRGAVEKLRSEERILTKLLKLQEQERRLLAYDIHDGLTQDVVGAKMLVESLRDKLLPEQEACRADLDAVERVLGTAIGECRRMIGDLRPLVIDERGIIEAIRYLVGDEQSRGRLQVQFEHDTQFNRLAPLLEGTLFRIVQEALNNVRRHSRSSVAQVKLVQHGSELTLEISDHGVGFDPAATPDDRFGLEGICKRTELFGGRATIASAPGRGTRVIVTVPMLLAAEDDELTPKPS